MGTTMATYIIYGVAAVALTGVLAHTLYNNGKIFLAEVFIDNERLARAVNSMLVTGFYMLNLGYAFMLFQTEEGATGVAAVENLVQKLGYLLLSLGILHFVNMGVIWKVRRAVARENEVPASVTTRLPAPPAPEASPTWAPA